MDPLVGVLCGGRYLVTQRLAEGAMGVVYRGERIGLGRSVAIKFLREPRAELRRRFEIEAKAASRMSHPNCVPVIDYGVDEDTPFLVMDFVGGRTLRELLDDGPLSIAHALRIVQQILAGLEHIHAHGVVHRDLKPENILVWADAMGEHVQIADFGLAKVDQLCVSQHVAIGTPTYMAPEQTTGSPVDPRTDLYGVGILLFELLADQPPFRGATPFDTMALHRDRTVPWFADLAPDRLIPPALEAVVRRALEKDPADRPASARAFAAALDDAVTSALEESNEIELPRSSGNTFAILIAALVGALWLALL